MLDAMVVRAVVTVLATITLIQLPASGALAQTIVKVPGVTVDESGVTVGDIQVNSSGIKAPGVTVDESGVTVDSGASEGSVTSTVIVGGGRVFVGGNYSRNDFSGEDLAGAVLEGGNFSRAVFDGANLRGAVFKSGNFSRASFRATCLEGAVFESSDFSRADFTDAILTASVNNRSQFSRSIMDGVNRDISCGATSQATSGNASQVSVVSERVEVTSSSEIQTSLASGLNARIDLTVNFEIDSDQIVGRAHEQLYEISAALSSAKLASKRILIEGHTDSSGSDNHNMDLSYRRALRVKRILVEEYNLDGARLDIKGFGESQPAASNDTESGRAINRRVTLVNLG